MGKAGRAGRVGNAPLVLAVPRYCSAGVIKLVLLGKPGGALPGIQSGAGKSCGPAPPTTKGAHALSADTAKAGAQNQTGSLAST